MSFKFKQFTINQEQTAMKVGTDGVLLGAWCALTGEERNILDIGTGTGLIAIMLAQRGAAPSIVGVEIDAEATLQAAQNMNGSKWSNRLYALHTSVQEFAPNYKFDVIVSNPPYFANSLLAKGDSRTTARHTTRLTFEELISATARLLTPEGRFSLILPTTESELFDKLCSGVLHLHRRCEVRGRTGGEVKRVMSEYRLYATDSIQHKEIGVRGDSHNEYSPEYRELTAEFYLKF